jgi:hypothetical protein
VLSGEATNTNFIVWFNPAEPTIYRTQGEHANHYTTAVVLTGNEILIRRFQELIEKKQCKTKWRIHSIFVILTKHSKVV